MMKYAADFRRIGRQALAGRWLIAVAAGLIAALLGGAAFSGPEVSLVISDSGVSVGINHEVRQIFSTDGGWSEPFTGLLIGGASLIFVGALVVAVVYIVLGSVVGTGYARFNLDLVDRQKEPELGTLFCYFGHWKTLVVANLLRGLYIFLWSLLFVIPGIVAGYSYAMTGYILAENPELTAGEAIDRSKQMMVGNRWRLFCLQLSFFGWDILAALTGGIGDLWLRPYKQAATAAFYREISGTGRTASFADPTFFDGYAGGMQ